MSPGCRPGTAAIAAVAIAAAIVLALRGIARTPAPAEPSGTGGPLLGGRIRAWYRALLEPFEEALVRSGVSADALTGAQLVVSALAGASFATGAIFLAGWLTILAGTLDVLDGGVARRGGTAGRRGALVDSVVDRCAEFATFVGLGALFHQSWLLAVVAVAAFASFMVSYMRARAEGLGLRLESGGAQRPERYVLLGLGAVLSSLVAHLACPWTGGQRHPVLAAVVVLLAGLAAWTAVVRAREAIRALDGAGRP